MTDDLRRACELHHELHVARHELVERVIAEREAEAKRVELVAKAQELAGPPGAPNTER